MKKNLAPTQKPNVFEFQEYKAYLNAWIASHPSGGRGVKTKIAEQARCHLAHVSQVLSGFNHFTIEQADSLIPFLEHTEDEANFFLLLVEYARAGTTSLSKRLEKRIKKTIEQRQDLKNRFTEMKSLTIEDQAIYYSHWAYIAIHLAVLVPKLRSSSAIAKYFNMDLQKTAQILEFLARVGLVKNEGGSFLPGHVRMHLAHDSPMISKHHANWRMKAIQSFEQESPQELHYSGVISLSFDDLTRVREILARALEEVGKVVKDSKDETIYCYSLDLFGLGKE
jgi:uncharacterized protein (TIGR02147 family)